MKNYPIFVYALIAMILSACGSSQNDYADFEKTPVDDLIKEMTYDSVFTIILYDMDINESTNSFRHQYRIIKQQDTLPYDSITEWHTVPQAFFEYHINDMGMEIAAKSDGKVTKAVAPPGYSNYVGNKRYGKWESGPQGDYWSFYPHYHNNSGLSFLTGMGIAYLLTRNSHNNFRRNYGNNSYYYGPRQANGRYAFGTGSAYSQKNNRVSAWNSKASNQSFANKVNSRVTRSSSGSRRGGYRAARSSSSSRSRSGSRYGSSGKSSRSRSGSYGK